MPERPDELSALDHRIRLAAPLDPMKALNLWADEVTAAIDCRDVRRVERLLSIAKSVDWPDIIKAAIVYGDAYAREQFGDHDAALGGYERSIRYATDTPGERSIARAATNQIVGILSELEDIDAAEVRIRSLLDATTHDDVLWRVKTTFANVLIGAGRIQEAQELLAQVSVPDPLLSAPVRFAQANAMVELGQLGEAQRIFIEVAEDFRAGGDANGFARTLGALGSLEARAGDPVRAESIFVRAQEIFVELGDTGGVAVTLRNRAAVASDPSWAAILLREAEQTARAGGLGRTADRYREERLAIDPPPGSG